MTTNPMPKAKTERLIVREIDGETLVYDRSRDAASCLNEFAARVWRECDGETSVAAIAAALGEDERAVWLALHQLTKAQLLTEAIAFPPDMSAAKSRREIGARLGLGAAAVVASIVAPMPAQAARAADARRRCTPVEIPAVRGNCCAGLGSCASVFAVYERLGRRSFANFHHLEGGTGRSFVGSWSDRREYSVTPLTQKLLRTREVGTSQPARMGLQLWGLPTF